MRNEVRWLSALAHVVPVSGVSGLALDGILNKHDLSLATHATPGHTDSKSPAKL